VETGISDSSTLIVSRTIKGSCEVTGLHDAML